MSQKEMEPIQITPEQDGFVQTITRVYFKDMDMAYRHIIQDKEGHEDPANFNKIYKSILAMSHNDIRRLLTHDYTVIGQDTTIDTKRLKWWNLQNRDEYEFKPNDIICDIYTTPKIMYEVISIASDSMKVQEINNNNQTITIDKWKYPFMRVITFANKRSDL